MATEFWTKMVEPIEPPIVINSEGDLMTAATQAEAEGFLEPWSVQEGNLELFDSNGRVLKAEIGPGGYRAPTHITPTCVVDPERLRMTILDFLKRGGVASSLTEEAEKLPLMRLIAVLPQVS